MEQSRLFHAEHLPVRLPYQNLYSHLPIFPAHAPPASPRGGRPPIDRKALLRALVYRALRRLASLSDLVQALRENPAELEALGLDPLGDIPSVERLLAMAMQDLPTRGIDSARNLCTIAHITVLLVALAAHRTACSDQPAFVRTFVPNLIDMPPEKPVL